MNYEAVIFDAQRGHHRRGEGHTPDRAVLAAFRGILKFELPQAEQNRVDELRTEHVMTMFMVITPQDEFMEQPLTLKEDVHELRILVRVDREKENMYTPVGFVHPTI